MKLRYPVVYGNERKCTMRSQNLRSLLMYQLTPRYRKEAGYVCIGNYQLRLMKIHKGTQTKDRN